MPQIDIFSFPSQLFWLLMVLVFIYTMTLRKVLPTILVLKRRRLLHIKLSLNMAKIIPSLSYQSYSRSAYDEGVLDSIFDFADYMDDILSDNYKFNRYGVRARFVDLYRRKFFIRNFKSSTYKRLPLLFAFPLNDDIILFLSFSIFVYGLYSFITPNLNFYEIHIRELRDS
jgi:hypothetical protein